MSLAAALDEDCPLAAQYGAQLFRLTRWKSLGKENLSTNEFCPPQKEKEQLPRRTISIQLL